MRHQGRSGLGVVGGILLGIGGLLGVASEAVAAGEADFVGLPPCRLVDTRGNGFTGAFGPPALAAAVARDFPLHGQCGIPTSAVAVSLNVTATDTLGPGFLLLFPQGGASWPTLLRRVFAIEVLVCPRCAGPRRILGAVTEPHAVRRVLVALGLAPEPPPGRPITAA